MQPPAQFTEKKNSSCILLVEDERSVRTVTKKMLTAAGYEVCEAQDASEALGLLREHAKPFAMVITDVVLPRISGPEMVASFNGCHSATRVLYITGYSHETITERGIRMDAPDILEKPFDMNQLIRRVDAILGSNTESQYQVSRSETYNTFYQEPFAELS